MTESPAVPLSNDPFFEVIHDGEWNACVGIQGSELNYVDGYMEAAKELVTAVIEKRMIGSRDTLAMPILYNCRHALELTLKFSIDRLHRMGILSEVHPVNHDILSHWKHLNNAGIGDAKLIRFISEIEPYVVSLAGIDEDGQELRYARTREGAKSLGNVAVVNLPLIRRSILELSEILDRLEYRILDLEDERTTSTHTKECSRTDLEQIAIALGNQSSWRDSTFIEKKQLVMEQFGIGSRKFSDAVNAIQKSRPLSAHIGREVELLHLSDDKATKIFELWIEANPIRDNEDGPLAFNYFDRDWADFKASMEITRGLNFAINELLSNEEFSDLETVYYIGRNRELGEHYEAMLSGTIKKHKATPGRYDGIHHIMSKTNLLDAFVEGATAVGRPGLSKKIRSLRPI